MKDNHVGVLQNLQYTKIQKQIQNKFQRVWIFILFETSDTKWKILSNQGEKNSKSSIQQQLTAQQQSTQLLKGNF